MQEQIPHPSLKRKQNIQNRSKHIEIQNNPTYCTHKICNMLAPRGTKLAISQLYKTVFFLCFLLKFKSLLWFVPYCLTNGCGAGKKRHCQHTIVLSSPLSEFHLYKLLNYSKSLYQSRVFWCTINC